MKKIYYAMNYLSIPTGNELTFIIRKMYFLTYRQMLRNLIECIFYEDFEMISLNGLRKEPTTFSSSGEKRGKNLIFRLFIL